MIKWNEVTWYTRILSIILFIGVIPVLAFFIGMRYQETVGALSGIPQAINDYRLVHFTPQQHDAGALDVSAGTAPSTAATQGTSAASLPTNISYSFTESGGSLISPLQYTLQFQRDLLGGYAGELIVSGFHLYYDWDVAVNLKSNGDAVVLYSSATPKSQGTNSFTPGDVLFTLVPASNGYQILWGAFQPQLPTSTTGSVFLPNTTS